MFLLFLNCLLLFSIPSTSQPPPTLNLLRFREALPENSRLLLSWNQTTSLSSHCHWPGVSCYSSKDFRIRSLNLTIFGLSGVLESSISNLCTLPDLITLDLSGNNFTGNVPSVLGNCSKLNTVFLNDNRFSGLIPPEIFKSRTLQQLDLSFNQLSETIPPEVGQCKSLEYLVLNDNLLNGEIPKELFSLPNLEFLSLSTNNLTGNLPDFPSNCSISDFRIHKNSFRGSLPLSLNNCHKLRILYASSSNLGGTLPQNVFQGLWQLEHLYLAENNFEGEIPKSLWGLRNLQELVIFKNRFNGSISEEISQWDKLTYLDLSENSLTGQIPTSVNLEYLYLYKNKFNGFIPPGIGNSSSLIEFTLDDNQISGILPLEICDIRSLKVLRVSNNQIKGPIPDCVERLTSLEELALSNNSFTGRIPSGISNLTKLTILALAHDNLTGEVSSDLGKNIPGLVKMDLTGNHLTGEIPREICAGNSLSRLTLGDNLFTGSFPEEIIKCKSLTRIILNNNLLQGEIPENIENRSSISHFDVRGNLLEGKIPRAFGFWSNLSMIDLSANKFSGSIPKEFGRLQNLVELRISSNRLTGEIPRELASCSKITELDLSKNKLSGGVPLEIVSSLTLSIIQLQENEFTGVIPDLFLSGQNLHELQLGNNMLEGSIPCSLRKVRHFSFLNLSMNRFSGEIPKCIGDLDKLETLDISSNGFSGEIPSETNNMESLSFVNISFNLLMGRIPTHWAKLLDSHPESTFGNPRLCTISTKTSNCVGHQKSRTRTSILAGIITASVFLMAFVLASAYVIIIRACRSPPSSPHQSLLHHGSINEDLPEDLNFEDILRGTEGWNNKYVIGRGKHGTVYRTESGKSRKHWAVKKVDLSETKFSTEMRTLSLVRHRNVLRMRGYSIRDGCGFIVTEYMPEGTLYHLLHQRRPPVALNWEKRYRVALGIAQGLSYLHHDCVPQIIHRDIKSDNILLDSELEPKIGDFGAAKLDSDGDESPIVSAIVGTLGYIAPENAYSTRLTDKCDVYSYGVILLELLCRKLPVDPSFGEGLDMVSWVRKLVQDNNDRFGCLDGEIRSWEQQDQQEALWMMNLALQCTEMIPDIRPSMREVVGSLLKFSFQRKFSVEQRDHSSL